MKPELQRKHWEKAKEDNQNLILQNEMTTGMAKRVLVMIEEKLAEFPEPKPLPLPAKPDKRV